MTIHVVVMVLEVVENAYEVCCVVPVIKGWVIVRDNPTILRSAIVYIEHFRPDVVVKMMDKFFEEIDKE